MVIETPFRSSMQEQTHNDFCSRLEFGYGMGRLNYLRNPTYNQFFKFKTLTKLKYLININPLNIKACIGVRLCRNRSRVCNCNTKDKTGLGG